MPVIPSNLSGSVAGGPRASLEGRRTVRRDGVRSAARRSPAAADRVRHRSARSSGLRGIRAASRWTRRHTRDHSPLRACGSTCCVSTARSRASRTRSSSTTAHDERIVVLRATSRDSRRTGRSRGRPEDSDARKIVRWRRGRACRTRCRCASRSRRSSAGSCRGRRSRRRRRRGSAASVRASTSPRSRPGRCPVRVLRHDPAVERVVGVLRRRVAVVGLARLARRVVHVSRRMMSITSLNPPFPFMSRRVSVSRSSPS